MKPERGGCIISASSCFCHASVFDPPAYTVTSREQQHDGVARVLTQGSKSRHRLKAPHTLSTLAKCHGIPRDPTQGIETPHHEDFYLESLEEFAHGFVKKRC